MTEHTKGLFCFDHRYYTNIPEKMEEHRDCKTKWIRF